MSCGTRGPLWRAVAALALLAACDAGGPAAPPSCADHAASVSEALARGLATRDPQDAPFGVDLPEVARGEAPGPLPLLVVGADEVLFDGRGAGGLETVSSTAESLASDLRAALALREGDGPFEVALWAAPDVRLGVLVALLREAPPEVRFALLARAPAPTTPALPAWVTRDLARPLPVDEGEGEYPAVSVVTPEAARARRLAAAWPSVTRRCPAAAEAFPVEPTGRPEVREVEPLAEALRDCVCEARAVGRGGAEGIAAVAIELLRGADRPLVRLPPSLRFGPATGSAAELALDAELDVAGLAERLTARELSEEPLFLRAE